MLRSFKTRLAAYFLLLAVLPLGAAFWGFTSFAQGAELQRVDARLAAELRAGSAGYARALESKERAARDLAGRPALQRALAARDRRVLQSLVRGDFVRVEAPGISVGARPRLAASWRLHIRGDHGPLGDVVALLPLDARSLKQLSAGAGLAAGDRLAFLRTGARSRAGASTLSHRGRRYRGVAGGRLPEQPQVQLAALAPYERIQSDSTATRRRLLLALLASLLGVALVAALEGRGIVRSIREFAAAAQAIGSGQLDRRVPARGSDELARLARAFNQMAAQLQARLHELGTERRRLRDSITRMGEALAATHDPDELLRVITEATTEAADASGAILVAQDGAVVEVGRIDEGEEQLEIPLVVSGRLLGTIALYARQFDEESAAAARSFANHAAVALENADLHRMVELQAVEDVLTGLANRRRCDEVVRLEVARAQRHATELAIALCDLDGFKNINDRYGHAAGDLVLSETGACLREQLREVDVAGRWGGEEFILVLPHTGLDGAFEVAERVRGVLERHSVTTPEGIRIDVTASFGVAEFRSGMTVAELVGAADRALYAAKREGKNRVAGRPDPLATPA